MIPTIGVMIGVYIITRMFDLLLPEKGRWIVKGFAVLTLLVTILTIIGLLVQGSSIQIPK